MYDTWGVSWKAAWGASWGKAVSAVVAPPQASGRQHHEQQKRMFDAAVKRRLTNTEESIDWRKIEEERRVALHAAVKEAIYPKKKALVVTSIQTLETSKPLETAENDDYSLEILILLSA